MRSVIFILNFCFLLMIASGAVFISAAQTDKSKTTSTRTGSAGGPKKECQPQKDLRNSLSIIRNQIDLANRDMAKIKTEIENADKFLEQMKTECPDLPTADHEKKIAEFKTKYDKIIREQSGEKPSGAKTSVTTRDDGYDQAEEELKQAYYAARKILDIRSPNAYMFSDKQTVKQFYDACRAIDYVNRKPKLDALVQKYPKLKDESHYAQFTGVQQKINDLTEQFLVAHVNALIEESYKLKAGGKSTMNQAVEKAELAVMIMDAVLLVDPAQPKAAAIKKDARSAYDAMMKEFGSAIFTSPFHRKNAGRIVFSKTPITITSENEAAMTNRFKAGEMIYAMNYFNGTFNELTKTNNYGYTRLFADGAKIAELHFKLDSPQREQSYLFTEIVPDPKTASTRGAVVFTKALSELSPRVHKIKVTTENEYGEIFSEGAFELDCTAGLDMLSDMAKKIRDKELAKVVMPATKMKNAALENEMIAALSDWKEKPLRVVITQGDWEIHRHAITGAILYRTIGAHVAFKTPEGDCKLFSLSFKQDYDGKAYGKTQHHGVGDSQLMPCENVNK